MEKINLEQVISDILHNIGISASLKGYRYLRYGINLCVYNFTLIEAITKNLYPTIAQEFHTTPSRVERGIRHAIEVGWGKQNYEELGKFFRNPMGKKPTNSEFVANIADSLRLKNKIESINPVTLQQKVQTELEQFQYSLYFENNKYGVIGNGIATIPIFSDRKWAKYFVDTINSYKDVSPIHLNDILQDFLVSYSF